MSLFASRYANTWAMTVHEIALLLRAGTPLLTALDTVAAQHRGGYRAALAKVRDRIAAGASLSEALAEQPDIFDVLSVQLVEVGENAGNLEEVLRKLAEFKQRMVQLKDQVFTALLYPAFVLCFGIVATLFLMAYVLPPLLDSLAESVDALPWPTRVVKAGSDLLLQHQIGFAVVGAMTAFVLLTVMRTKSGRYLVDRYLLKVPLLGQMAMKQSVSRIAMVISTLVGGGVPLTKALQLAARSTGNLVLREALDDCGRSVGAGQDIGVALRRTGVFPPLVVQIFSVGQEAGELEEMLNQLSADYNRQVAALSARLAALLEPLLIILLAGFIGFVLVATILPILEAGNVL
jgi:type II secretory pathway component PulF